MTRRQKRTARLALVSLLVAGALLGTALFPRLISGETSPSSLGEAGTQTQVYLHIPNKTGTTVCGLQASFVGLLAPAIQAVEQAHPFKKATPTDEYDGIAFREGCLKPDEEAVLRFAQGAGLGVSLREYAWVKPSRGMKEFLIPGNFEGVRLETRTVVHQAVLPPAPQEEADLMLTPFAFQMLAPPNGRLLVTQGDTIYEGQLVAITDQVRRDEVLRRLSQSGPLSGLFNARKRLERELARLEVHSAFNAVVKALAVEVDGDQAKVTLQLQLLGADMTPIED